LILAVGRGFGILAVSTGYGAVWLYGAVHAAIDGEAHTASPWSATLVFLDDVGVGWGALGALK
jgi:hypothetical protein